MSVQADLEKLLDQIEIVKELNRDLKDIIESHNLTAEINEAKKSLKSKKDELEKDPDVAQLREEIGTAKERLQLLREILVAKMQEEELPEVNAKGKKAVLARTLKIEKDKK